MHYPGTYLAGGYNRLVSEVAGRKVENEDLVNMPNWLPLTFRIDDGPGSGSTRSRFCRSARSSISGGAC
jgi:trehalose/maltose hydrolase-like predicted phosphorylase